MNKHYEALELPKILERLAALTACEEAHEQALALTPATDFFEAERLLSQTEAAIRRAVVRRTFECQQCPLACAVGRYAFYARAFRRRADPARASRDSYVA